MSIMLKSSFLKQVLPLLKPYRGGFLLGILAILIASITFLSIGWGLRFLIDKGFAEQNPHILNQGLLILGLVVLILSLASYTRFFCLSWVSEKMTSDLREKLLTQFLTLDNHFFKHHPSGVLVTQLTNDLTLVQTTLAQIFPVILRNILLFMGGVTLLFWTSVKLAGLTLLLIPLILMPAFIVARQVKKATAQTQKAFLDQGQFLTETLQSQNFIRAIHQEHFFQKRFHDLVSETFSKIIQRLHWRSFLIVVVFVLVFLAIGFVLWVGGHDVLKHEMSAGDLSSFIFYAIVSASALSVMGESYPDLIQTHHILLKLLSYLSLKPTLSSPQNPQKVIDSAPEIAVNNLFFTYHDAYENKWVHENLNFNIKAGEKIGLVGASGAGKSSFFNLLLRLYDPQKGKIFWNGVSIDQFLSSDLRQKIAYIPQEPVLFSLSVFENITLGNKASYEEVYEAARESRSLEFIENLPNGFQTIIGPKGITLSGGEKQRLSLARAFLKKPSLILLDEATNALDNQNELEIQQALDRLMEHKTAIVIAHRLSTIEHLDRIIVFDKGKVVEEGAHHALLAQNGLYAAQYLRKREIKEDINFF